MKNKKKQIVENGSILLEKRFKYLFLLNLYTIKKQGLFRKIKINYLSLNLYLIFFIGL